MSSWFAIVLSTALVNNFVLARFLGLCPFMGVSRSIDTALGMGLATTFVLTLAAILSFLLDTYILQPLNASFLRIIAFIVLIAALVQFTELWMRMASPLLHRLLGLYLPLITTNCAVLGVALLTIREKHTLANAAASGFGAALGFTLALVLFAALRERIETADVPAPFKGSAVALMTAGIMSLAFMGFSGIDSGL